MAITTPLTGDTNWGGSGGTSGTKLNDTLGALDTRLVTAEGSLVTLDTRLDTAEADITALEAADTALDTRLDAVEAAIDTSASMDTQNTAGTTSSSAYTNTLTGGTAAFRAFVAPPSGAVLIHSMCELFNSTSGQLTICSIRVMTGAIANSGSTVLAVSDDEAIMSTSTVSNRYGVVSMVTGMTSGSTYHVQQFYRVTGGTGTFGRKKLIVSPVL